MSDSKVSESKTLDATESSKPSEPNSPQPSSSPSTQTQDDSTSKPLTAKERDFAAAHDNAFAALESDFRDVLSELVGDKSLERFRTEYEKLHLALKKSHENEKKLIKKCRELNSEIVSNASKVQHALRMSRSDQNNITLLKKEIDNAWKIVAAAQEKEKRARETIQRLKGEIEKLSRLVDQGAGLSIGQENAVNQLMKEKQELLVEIESIKQSLAAEIQKNSELAGHVQDIEQKKFDVDRQAHELRTKLQKMESMGDRDSRRADRLQSEIASLKEVNQSRCVALARREQELEDSKAENTTLLTNKREMEYALDKYRDVAEELRLKNEELEKSVQFHIQNESALLVEKESAEKDGKHLKDELRKRTQEVLQHSRHSERMEADKLRLQSLKLDAERQRDKLRTEMTQVQREVVLQARNADTDEKLIKDMEQQIKRLNASLQASREKNKAHLRLMKQYEETKKSLESDILAHKAEEERLRRRNYELEKQREKVATDAAQWQNKFQEQVEMHRLQELHVNELNKCITDGKSKLKLQQNLYEQVRADRNLFSKQHIQSQDEIVEMKRKFKIMTHQIDQLKEEIQTKDQSLINEHFSYKRLKDEMKVMKRKLAKREEVLGIADRVLASQDSEVKNLRKTLTEAENAQRMQKQVYDDVVQERDILGAQLIRRNDELALLYEKIRIQQSTLNKGELQYRERVREVQLLKLKVNDMKRELELATQDHQDIGSLQSELQHAQRELLQERNKVRALSEELENPMNVHRWRKLEGSDPARFELIQKIQMLQKRLISKTEEAVEKDMLLQEKERLYLELKNILARQPGPEVAEQLSVYQQSLKEKTRQMKAMAAEMNMLQAQANEYRYEIDRVTKDLQDTRRKLYEQRKAEKEKEREKSGASAVAEKAAAAENLMSEDRITGGGFSLKQK
jgi:cilia- and flagella-associated protein 58